MTGPTVEEGEGERRGGERVIQAPRWCAPRALMHSPLRPDRDWGTFSGTRHETARNLTQNLLPYRYQTGFIFLFESQPEHVDQQGSPLPYVSNTNRQCPSRMQIALSVTRRLLAAAFFLISPLNKKLNQRNDFARYTGNSNCTLSRRVSLSNARLEIYADPVEEP